MARYIDADKLVAELQKKPIHDGHFIHTRDVSDAIFYAPTISPDEVRGVGEWILKQDNWWGGYVECSICHDEYTVPEGGLNFKFCPNCGSKMKGY